MRPIRVALMWTLTDKCISQNDRGEGCQHNAYMQHCVVRWRVMQTIRGKLLHITALHTWINKTLLFPFHDQGMHTFSCVHLSSLGIAFTWSHLVAGNCSHWGIIKSIGQKPDCYCNNAPIIIPKRCKNMYLSIFGYINCKTSQVSIIQMWGKSAPCDSMDTFSLDILKPILVDSVFDILRGK